VPAIRRPVEVLSAPPRDVALLLCLRCSLLCLIEVATRVTTSLGASHLPAPHRNGHEQDDEHDRDRNHDDHDAGANREHES
jgi:hypothetical protein